MNKEEKNSHVLPFKPWMVRFSPWCRTTPQGITEKNRKFRVIFDSLTQTRPNEVILNHQTSTDDKAVIDFGQAKNKFLINIYNWRMSHPNEIIYLLLVDITACFRFPRILADVTGAFGFIAENLYFISTSHIFGSNTSARSWESLRRAIQHLIHIFSKRDNLVDKHCDLLNLLKWLDDLFTQREQLTRAHPCELNQGINDDDKLTAVNYVDDILGATVFRKNMKRLLAAIIEAIFTICGRPDTAVRQCPLSLKKWDELIVGPRQIVLGLVVDKNKMTVGITDDYLDQVRGLLNQWDKNRRMFKVNDMQKLMGKSARLGEGAPWIFKLMTHLYTSLAFALKNNTELLEKSSSGFRTLVHQIETKKNCREAI